LRDRSSRARNPGWASRSWRRVGGAFHRSEFAANSQFISEFFKIQAVFASFLGRCGDITARYQYDIGDSLLRRIAANSARRTANVLCGIANSSDLLSKMIAAAVAVIVEPNPQRRQELI
jgi:hypothetical protein